MCHLYATGYKFSLNARVYCAWAVFWVIQEDDGNWSKVMSLKITYQVARRGQD